MSNKALELLLDDPDEDHCEICGDIELTDKCVIWDVESLPGFKDLKLWTVPADNPDIIIVCEQCDVDMSDEQKPMTPDDIVKAVKKLQGKKGPYQKFKKVREPGKTPDSVDDWMESLYGKFPVVTGSGPAVPAGPPKCSTSHFNLISFPDNPGWGHIRPTSERGGLDIDTAADYALFFSSGWKSAMMAKDVEYWTPPGHKANAIPDLSVAEDMSKWPDMAFVHWRDYGPPTTMIGRYSKWAAEQVKAGKSVQFGCMGGHGRTGTFLALLLLDLGIVADGEAAVEWVHTEYCKDAIEGKAQKEAILEYR